MELQARLNTSPSKMVSLPVFPHEGFSLSFVSRSGCRHHGPTTAHLTCLCPASVHRPSDRCPVSLTIYLCLYVLCVTHTHSKYLLSPPPLPSPPPHLALSWSLCLETLLTSQRCQTNWRVSICFRDLCHSNCPRGTITCNCSSASLSLSLPFSSLSHFPAAGSSIFCVSVCLSFSLSG